MLDPTNSLLNSVIRGSVVYLALFAALRLFNNRRSGSIGVSGLLLITLASGAVQSSMVGEGRSQPSILVRDGRVIPAGLRRELLTRDDLMAELRGQRIEDLSMVTCAQIEANGTLSVIGLKD